jgi:hypothetical protein
VYLREINFFLIMGFIPYTRYLKLYHIVNLCLSKCGLLRARDRVPPESWATLFFLNVFLCVLCVLCGSKKKAIFSIFERDRVDNSLLTNQKVRDSESAIAFWQSRSLLGSFLMYSSVSFVSSVVQKKRLFSLFLSEIELTIHF